MALPIEIARKQTALENLKESSTTRVGQINKWITDASLRGSNSLKFRSSQEEYETLKGIYEKSGYQVTYEIQKMPVVDLQNDFTTDMVYHTIDVLSVVIKW